MKKKYEKPEADIILFHDEDIIVTSSDGYWGTGGGTGGDDWGNN